MSWFKAKPCAVCTEKDARIADLRNQIQDLRRLAIPPSGAQLLTPVAREADLLLNPDTDAVEITEAEYEAARLMSGSYDNWQVETES